MEEENKTENAGDKGVGGDEEGKAGGKKEEVDEEEAGDKDVKQQQESTTDGTGGKSTATSGNSVLKEVFTKCCLALIDVTVREYAHSPPLHLGKEQIKRLCDLVDDVNLGWTDIEACEPVIE